MVVKVTDKEIFTKVRGNGETSSMPYGMVVWSTGIAPHAIIKDFMKQVGQVCSIKSICCELNTLSLTSLSWLLYIFNCDFRVCSFEVIFCWGILYIHCANHLLLLIQTNRRALATDEWLRVEGCDSIYALGDCATVNQRRVMVLLIFYLYYYSFK